MKAITRRAIFSSDEDEFIDSPFSSASASEADFPFGANVPQDTQDSQDFQDSQGNSKTISDCSRSNSEKILSQPLTGYLRKAYEFSEKLKEDDTETWHSPLFFFARFCKAHPSIIDLPDDKATQAVESVMSTWNDLPRNRDPWEYYFGDAGDPDAARIDFMNSWNNIRHIPFHEPLSNALRLAEKSPLKTAHERGNLYNRFIGLAGWLQVLRRGENIYLPTRAVAKLLVCDQRTVSRLRKLAMQDELLTVVKQSSFRSAGKSDATEFRFAVERFNVLMDANDPD